MTEPTRTEAHPHDRLTRLCEAMTAALEAHPEYREGDRGIVFLSDDKRGGLVLFGYDDDMDAMADLLVHLTAVFKANGKTLMVVPVGSDG